MTSAGDPFPGTAEVLLHLGNDGFPSRLFDGTVTGDAAFLTIELCNGVKILTGYPADLRRLASRLTEAADQLQAEHRRGTAPAAVRAFGPAQGSVLLGYAELA